MSLLPNGGMWDFWAPNVSYVTKLAGALRAVQPRPSIRGTLFPAYPCRNLLSRTFGALIFSFYRWDGGLVGRRAVGGRCDFREFRIRRFHLLDFWAQVGEAKIARPIGTGCLRILRPQGRIKFRRLKPKNRPDRAVIPISAGVPCFPCQCALRMSLLSRSGEKTPRHMGKVAAAIIASAPDLYGLPGNAL